ncbi:MAG: hypothetical protein ACR2NU_11085 [Aeoliella sp.]
MGRNDLHQSPTLAVGILGVLALLLASLVYAVWDSQQFYRSDHIEQTVEEAAFAGEVR